MNEAVELFRRRLKTRLYEELSGHKGTTTYDNGVKDGLLLAVATVIDEPAPEGKDDGA